MHCYCFIDWSGSFLFLLIFTGAPMVTAIIKSAKYLLVTDLCFNRNLKSYYKVFRPNMNYFGKVGNNSFTSQTFFIA